MYRIVVSPAAELQIKKLGKSDAKRIFQRLVRLEEDPRPSGCKKLTGVAHLYRIRSGVWRIVYQVDDSARRVEVVQIGHRKDIYRDL